MNERLDLGEACTVRLREGRLTVVGEKGRTAFESEAQTVTLELAVLDGKIVIVASLSTGDDGRHESKVLWPFDGVPGRPSAPGVTDTDFERLEALFREGMR